MSAIRRIQPSYDPLRGAASARAVVAALRASGIAAAAQGTPLELREAEAPPRIESAISVEGSEVSVRAVGGDPSAGIVAFLDGIQRSTTRAHVGTVPIVHGAVAAAIRVRQDRRLRTWGEAHRSHACYLPRPLVDAAFVDALATRCAVVDTLAELDPGSAPPQHPAELSARALTAVQRRREREELALATAWAAEGHGPLLVDGGIAGSEAVARSPLVVGVVKSHRTVYAPGESLALILGLREGERSTAVVLSSPRRVPVATWYLRLRDPGARGPFFGLVRVEAALRDADAIAERADTVSRWLLAERRPVSLPDARWDVMVYGIRECEEYLQAILI